LRIKVVSQEEAEPRQGKFNKTNLPSFSSLLINISKFGRE